MPVNATTTARATRLPSTFAACIVLAGLLAAPAAGAPLDQLAKFMSPERFEYDDYVLSLAADDEMGRSVSFEGNLGVFGAHRDDEGGDFAGAVFLFDLQTGEQTGKLIASDPGTFDGFGQNVGISNNTIIVASPLNDIDGERVGSAYLFNATTGVEITKLTSPTPHADDRFGFDVGVHGSTAIVTAAAESTVGDGFGAA